MTYLNTRRFKKEGSILYNNVGTNTLHGIYLEPDNLSTVGNYKKILAGSFLTTDKRIHGAAKVISPYSAGDSSVVVDNPWCLIPGDVLYQIGDRSNDAAAERMAYENKTTEFGTVTAIDAGTGKFKATITPSAIAIDDVYTLMIDDLSVSVVAVSTEVKDLLELLIAELNRNGRSDLGVLDYLNYAIEDDTLVISAAQTGNIFTVNTNVSGAGLLTVEVAPGIGSISITPGAGNTALEIGVKLSTVGSSILGVLAHTKYLTNDARQEMTADTAAYDTANINLKALPYIDGAIVKALPTLKFMPPYGV